MVNSYEMTAAGFKPNRVVGRNFFWDRAVREPARVS
jgi:hypothetical protein